ncbi:MAG: LysR family transcriptional regulator [Ruminiclostridium sp.]|nr:LysR family transcriptional regulator [Ruminiclostridium sp.]
MTIQQIKYVITIYETGQFSKAGEKLYVTQPSLSKAVRDLESELGITIFERMNKGIVVTDAGEEFITYAREVNRMYEQLYEKFRDPGNTKRRFGVSCQHYSFASKAFMETVAMLECKCAQSAGIKFDFAFRETRTSEVIRDVSTLRSEVGILFTADFNSRYIERLLDDYELVLQSC